MLLTKERFQNALDDAIVVRLACFDDLRVHLTIAGRYAIIGGALKHGEMLGLLGDFRNGLNRGGASTDHRHSLAGKINPLVRKAAGVIPFACKIFQALKGGNVCVR